MNRTMITGLLLSLAAQTGPLSAQGNGARPIDDLYERGQSEMAPNWRPLAKTHAAAVFIHNDIRKADSGRLSVWTHRELPSVEYFEKEKAYLSTRERMLVDCKSARVGATDLSYYAERFAAGAIVGSSRSRNAEMADVVPDSIEDQLVRTACAPKPRKAPAPKPKAAKAPKPTSE